MKKRCLAAALALVLLAALLPISTSAADSDFTISNGVLTKYKGSGGKVTIPSSVTSIGAHAFNGCTTVTSVTIPSSVTSIGNYAFAGCKNLTSISISNSVTSIGDSVFSSCSSLTSVALPSRLTSIPEFAFAYCASLTSVDIPSSVTSIGIKAFNSCKSLSRIYLPSGLTSIREGAFNLCTSLTSVTIPGSVVTLEGSAFQDCTALTSVTLQEGVSRISPYMFSGCTSLRSVDIPSTVTSIGTHAFSGCKALAEVTLPYGLTSIDDGVFYYSGLTSMTVPETVTNIGSGAFSGCSSLTRIVIPKNTRLYDSNFSIDSPVFSYDKSLTVYGYTGSSAESHCQKFNIPFVPIGTEITFHLFTPPSFQEGGSVALQGTVTSKYSTLRSVSAKIYQVLDSGTHSHEQTASDSVNGGYTYEIDRYSRLNTGLDFTLLEPGRYFVRYTATTRDGTSKSEDTGVFQVTIDLCKRNGHTESEDISYSSAHPHHRYSVCSVCGKSFDTGVVDEWNEWKLIRRGSCTVGQILQRSCALADQGCTVTQTEESEPWGHTDTPLSAFEAPVLATSFDKPAGCTTPGGTYRYCYRCREYCICVKSWPAEGHIYALDHADETETVYTCSRCHDSVTRPCGTVGTAQEGYLAISSLHHLTWSVSADGLVQVDFGDPPAGLIVGIPMFVQLGGQSAWVACYDEDGRLLDVKILGKDNLTAQIDPASPLVKLFWLDGGHKPLSQSEIVWTS